MVRAVTINLLASGSPLKLIPVSYFTSGSICPLKRYHHNILCIPVNDLVNRFARFPEVGNLWCTIFLLQLLLLHDDKLRSCAFSLEVGMIEFVTTELLSLNTLAGLSLGSPSILSFYCKQRDLPPQGTTVLGPTWKRPWQLDPYYYCYCFGGALSLKHRSQLPQTFNTQRCTYFSSLPIQTISRLIWGHFLIWTNCSRYEHITWGQDEAKNKLNLYMPVETSACTTHPGISQSP